MRIASVIRGAPDLANAASIDIPNVVSMLLQKIVDPALEIGSHPVLEAIINLIATERAGL